MTGPVPPAALAAARAAVPFVNGDACRRILEAAAPHIAAANHDDEGYEPFVVAEGWREETEIRFVPESAVAEAVAAERERCARHLEALAANYPPDVFPPDGTSRDAIGGSAMRHALANAARSLREDELREQP